MCELSRPGQVGELPEEISNDSPLYLRGRPGPHGQKRCRLERERDTLALAHYVAAEVPELAQRHFNHPEYPTVKTNAQAFPLTKVR